jgi:glycerophosphoryl diester phosphodiesterase
MVLVIAHRGYSGRYPENTMLALRKAVECGCDGIEFDVRATKDSRIVLFHDETLKRLCKVKGRISSMRLADVQKLDVSGEKIPLLDEALDFLKSTSIGIINIEVKVKGYEEELLELVYSRNLDDNIVFSSQYSSVLEKLRELDPEIRLGYVVDNRPDKWRILRRLSKKIKLYSLHPFHNRPISNKLFVRAAKKRQLLVLAWFLREYKSLKRMQKLKNLGIDGVITDYPEEVISLLKKT